MPRCYSYYSVVNRIIVTRHLGSAANLVIPTSKFAGKNDFSTSEVDTGYKWINGKTIYRKTVNCGTMPNSSTTAINHGITGLTAVVEYRGIGFNIPGMQFIDFQQGNGINTYIDATKINIATTIARSQFTAYMTLWYTK